MLTSSAAVLDNLILRHCLVTRLSYEVNPNTLNRDGERERSYEVEIREFHHSKNALGAITEFKVQSSLEHEPEITLAARYFYHYAAPEVDEKQAVHLIEELTRLSIWPLFSALMKQILAHGAQELPPLPPKPQVHWLSSDDDTAERQSQSVEKKSS